MKPNLIHRRAKLGVCMLLAFGLVGCASTSAPVVYPSKKASVAQRLDADLQACRAEADQAVGVNSRLSPEAGERVARRGVVEFVDKAVESLVVESRNAWARARGAAAGTVAGSITTVALNWNEPDAVNRKYVDECLRDRGHKVLGWR